MVSQEPGNRCAPFMPYVYPQAGLVGDPVRMDPLCYIPQPTQHRWSQGARGFGGGEGRGDGLQVGGGGTEGTPPKGE